jgi:AbrB family looped-hinge helix DNA binding protein
VEEMVEVVVSISKKGQFTIPKELRQKYGIKEKVLLVEYSEGILLKPVNP